MLKKANPVDRVGVDVHKSSPKGFRCSERSRENQKCPYRLTIGINDEESGGDNSAGNEYEGGDVDGHATSGKKSLFPSCKSNNSDDLNNCNCQIVDQESNFPFELSECMQMHPCNGPSRNRFGLYTDSESSSSESEGSDSKPIEDPPRTVCERQDEAEAVLRRKVLEDIYDSSWEILEKWEEAALREKVLADIYNCDCRLDDEGSSSRPDTNHINPSLESVCKNVDVEIDTDNIYCCMNEQAPDYPANSSSSNEKEKMSTVSATSKHEGKNPVADFYPTFNQVSHESADFYQNEEDAVLEKLSMNITQSQHDIWVSDESMAFHCCQDAVSGEPLSSQAPLQGEIPGNSGRSFQTNKEDSLGELMWIRMSYSGNVDNTPEVQNNLLGQREKHKDTDEYKRAAKEEWESRQRQLLIQAKEAQWLRKRKRAENLRLLDTERRQKQRLEDMRRSQKKDEETMNLKEQLRVEFRKKLDKLEVQCQDMASLLHGLGIHVEGGPYPTAYQVNAAYKQALLRFHPDRASRSDIRRQVEAEEIFKLISRLKEKLVATA